LRLQKGRKGKRGRRTKATGARGKRKKGGRKKRKRAGGCAPEIEKKKKGGGVYLFSERQVEGVYGAVTPVLLLAKGKGGRKRRRNVIIPVCGDTTA